MKVLVATAATQGAVPGDYCFTVEGELVVFPVATCDCPDCGCERGVAGVSSSKATTTFTVVDRPELDLASYTELLRDGLRREGWISELGGDAWVDRWAREHAEIAASFPEGSVLEIRDAEVHVRAETADGGQRGP